MQIVFKDNISNKFLNASLPAVDIHSYILERFDRKYMFVKTDNYHYLLIQLQYTLHNGRYIPSSITSSYYVNTWWLHQLCRG